MAYRVIRLDVRETEDTAAPYCVDCTSARRLASGAV